MRKNEFETLQALERHATPFTGAAYAEALVDRAGEARFALIGEASHGTSAFYAERAELSKRLIVEKGFKFVAVEGDWPSCYVLNRYVKGDEAAGTIAAEALRHFARWPSWMWANREVAAFADWLRVFNDGKAAEDKVGFYGIDLYSLWESMEEILKYLGQKDGADLQAARRAFACFEPHGQEAQQYGLAANFYGEGCEDEVVELLRKLQDRWRTADPGDREEELAAELNALAVKGAEDYYRTMIRNDAQSWNVRDRHMVAALERLLAFHGPAARAIVWAHNTHIGDARATDMSEEGMVNVGQLLRESYGTEVYAVGFGTYEGTVIAGRAWGRPQEAMKVPPAQPGSLEELLHRIEPSDKLLMLDDAEQVLREAPVGHRAIGVVYDPEFERGNYVPTKLAERYDAFIFLDRTTALTPLAVEEVLN
ncbi:erythromycin esterase family protein [Cohnella rhizosphaerae]|uniref:Erythromycin esterase family protein n=1 Tax=Cohnella rhizosphaerae TaxID=1457232 RepID=A0A9X4QVL4_9BACL|nr:erythromycin esterase family protein [Cohnella rhizosphaerae]MDG0812860.1 erythromycin esterase family protein [Cohnella rhizosphaerae]